MKRFSPGDQEAIRHMVRDRLPVRMMARILGVDRTFIRAAIEEIGGHLGPHS